MPAFALWNCQVEVSSVLQTCQQIWEDFDGSACTSLHQVCKCKKKGISATLTWLALLKIDFSAFTANKWSKKGKGPRFTVVRFRLLHCSDWKKGSTLQVWNSDIPHDKLPTLRFSPRNLSSWRLLDVVFADVVWETRTRLWFTTLEHTNIEFWQSLERFLHLVLGFARKALVATTVSFPKDTQKIYLHCFTFTWSQFFKDFNCSSAENVFTTVSLKNLRLCRHTRFCTFVFAAQLDLNPTEHFPSPRHSQFQIDVCCKNPSCWLNQLL